MKKFNSLYNKRYSKEKGYVASVGQGTYNHRFGGGSWDVSSVNKITKCPIVLITLDLTDPILADFKGLDLEELPFCSELNYVFIGKQVYQLNNEDKTISLISIDEQSSELLPEEDQQSTPFPVKPLTLNPMDKDDYPVDEESYSQCCDEFLGGKSIIRVLGPPVWLEEPGRVVCNCGKEMEYVCSIGYEVDNEFCQLLDSAPFYPGELAHYFFLCKKCLVTATLVQST